MPKRQFLLICLWSLSLSASVVAAEQHSLLRYEAADSLAPELDADRDAQSCVEALSWKPGRFAVTCEGLREPNHRVIVRFPSPVPSGDAVNDQVTMEWYRPFLQEGHLAKIPAVLVVHESGRAMPVGRLFARALQAEGLHAFLIHLPYYGLRRGEVDRPEPRNLVASIRQAVADVRRARDAIAALPEVDADRIAVQGTSLGGFVVAISASLDDAYQGVFIMLAGGNLFELVTNGQQDAANFRRELEQAGYSGDALRKLLWQIEPTRIAHRMDPRHTWLYTAEQDRVVPMENALALARAARLEESHHVRIDADHYTGILHFATIVRQVAERVHRSE
ncbi:MAG: prolyl oligopeptidase family serine peptidase, partial [Planctomycetes bacterium]|nr:prolyl oligopeptidase family serine peptidase [Planctomycetota bacterium]